MHAKFINIHDIDYLSLSLSLTHTHTHTHVAKMDRFVVRRPRVVVEEQVSQTTDQLLTDSVVTAEQPPSSDSLETVEVPAKRLCLHQPSCSKTTSSADAVNVKMQRYKRNLKYNSERTVQWRWMKYDEQKGIVVCTYCKRFGKPPGRLVEQGCLALSVTGSRQQNFSLSTQSQSGI